MILSEGFGKLKKMKVVVLQENLNQTLTTVCRLTTTRSQLPILANILLKTEKGRLRLSATNLETGINYCLGAKVQKEGEITVPAKVILELVSSLSAGKVNLIVEGDILKVETLHSRAEVNGINAAEFPEVARFKGQPDFVFAAEKFREMIDQVCFAAAVDETRPVLAGARMAREAGNLVLAATDGYRLSVKKIKGFKSEKLKKALIVPARTLQEVARIKERGEVKLLVSKKENQIIFGLDDVEVVCRLIEGQFPDFNKVIPEDHRTRFLVDKEALVKAVKLAAIFARETANIVKFEIQDSSLEISANAPQVGKNASEIEIKNEGEENKIAFNFRYLLDFLTTVSAEEVIFEMGDPLNPGVFRLPKDDSFLHIIMPVRVQE